MNEKIKKMLNEDTETIIFENNNLMKLWNERTKYINRLQQENRQLKSQLECYKNGAYYDNRVDELGEWLQQRDEVIEDAIECIKSSLLGCELTDTDSIDVKDELLDILNKYKGDNK